MNEQENAIEKALVQGDLSALTVTERIMFYRQVCDSLGLNPLTKPFDYIKLNGKLLLYAKKDCTEQLRRIHHISLAIVSREDDSDVLQVTARATMPSGRFDEDSGCVCVKGLQGEALANAHMRAVTKAKRRVTLSICGLGFLDESEIASIPNGAVAEQAPAIEHRPDPDPGIEFQSKLITYDEQLFNASKIKIGELVEHIRKQGVLLGRPHDLAKWDAEVIAMARDWARTFVELKESERAEQAKSAPLIHAAEQAISPDKVKALQLLMARKRVSWNEGDNSICSLWDLAPTTMIEDLTPLQYDEIYKAVIQDPDRS